MAALLCFFVAVKMAQIDLMAGRKAFGAFTIGITFWQIVTVFGNLALDWPETVNAAFDAIGSIEVFSQMDRYFSQVVSRQVRKSASQQLAALLAV